MGSAPIVNIYVDTVQFRIQLGQILCSMAQYCLLFIAIHPVLYAGLDIAQDLIGIVKAGLYTRDLIQNQYGLTALQYTLIFTQELVCKQLSHFLYRLLRLPLQTTSGKDAF